MDNSWFNSRKNVAQGLSLEVPPSYPQQPISVADQVNNLPNAEKLSPVEKWLYQKLPGFSENSAVKALSGFLEGPAGKILQAMDVAAEGLERTLGLVAQYRDMRPGDDFDLKNAWAAGTLFYDTANLPRIRYDENGNIVGLRIDSDMPGAYVLTEARKLLGQGKSIDDIRGTLYANMGALALRSQLQDTLGHIAADPLVWATGWLKPVQRLHAIRNLALTGKLDVAAVKALEAQARLAGNLDEAAKLAQAITKAEEAGKAVTRLDRFVINLTGGTPYLEDVNKMSKAQKIISKINPFGLTPQSRASELLDMVSANVGEYLVRPNWNKDPEEFLKAVSAAARGSIGNEWGHLAMTIQGRTTQGILANSDAAAKALGVEWRTFRGERTLLQKVASLMPGMDERKLWKMAKNNPDELFKKILSVADTPVGQSLKMELQSGKLTRKTLDQIGKITNDIPLTREEFYAKALVQIQDVAMQQSILQFGIKEKGVLNKWSDALKAWETLPFIKANPANMMRNVVNNDITLIGRGLFGTMTSKAIKNYWKGKHIPEQFLRGFGAAGDVAGASLDDVADSLDNFNPGVAFKEIERVLEGSQSGMASKIKQAANKVRLGPFDFSEYSKKAEKAASLRASTQGWQEFTNKYWNPRTGFTSVKKYLDPDTVDEIERIIPGFSDLLDDAAQSAGADAQKLQELLEKGVDNNVTSIMKSVEDNLGYKVDDVIGTDVMQAIKDGLPEAIKSGKARDFIAGLQTQMEKHVDDMFDEHVKNLPGIVKAQVQAGGPLQYHRYFAKAMDEFWAGNTEHAIRMSTINEALEYARRSGDYKKVSGLWDKIFADGESHFARVWKKMNAYQEGLKEGSKAAGIKYPSDVANSFKTTEKGWKDFFNLRNTEYQKFFAAKLEGKEYSRTLDQIQRLIDDEYTKMIGVEDEMMQRIDDLMAGSLPDKIQSKLYMNYRDQVAELRRADRLATQNFYKNIRNAPSDEAPQLWTKFWSDRKDRVEMIRQMEMRGSAALQGDANSSALFTPPVAPKTSGAKDIYTMADEFGVASTTNKGARNDKRILNTVNKYLPEGTEKYKGVSEIPLDVAQQAFAARAMAKSANVTPPKQFIPDAEMIFKDPMPIETGLSELNYGRTYAVLDNLADEATSASTKMKVAQKLPEHLQAKVAQWAKGVEDEMSGFRSAAVQYASFRRDSALLNYNRRTNFDAMVGNFAPFAFWTTHSVFNWALHSIDRPAMLSTYLRMRKLFETAGLPDQNVPTRLKGNIRVNLPFTPDWMGDTFVDPMRFALPFDAFLMPWEQAQTSKFQMETKAKTTLNQMLETGRITEDEYNQAIQTQSGEAWDEAMRTAEEGGENYDAMDFVNMTATPHAPLMWAYNAATGKKNEIGPFTPMTRTVKNLATMMGVKDWSNSPYNVEARIRREMGLPAYDRWDDYRVGRMISNIAASGKYSMDDINQAMQVAALVESGKMTSADAVKQNPIYAEATQKANVESAGGWAGTVLSILGIPVRSYPVGEQQQRALGEEFSKAYALYAETQDPDVLNRFFDKHPEYETRLALFKKPEERLKTFMVDNVWARWNDLPKVTQDEMKAQLGDNFANMFINKETRNYDAVSPLQLQVWLKLMGGKPVGTLTADQMVMVELNQLRLTKPETAWRVQTFYDMRKTEHPDWYKLQNEYYALPEAKRDDFLRANPALKLYWQDRKKWMTNNPDLVRFLTDDPKQIAKYEKMRRKPLISVPTAQEIKKNISPEMDMLIQQWQAGEAMPDFLGEYLDELAREYQLNRRELIGILYGR